MRTALVCVTLTLAAPSVLADEASRAPSRSSLRGDGWDVQLLPARPEADAGKLAPVPEPAATLEPVPPLPHLKAPVCLETFICRLKHLPAATAADRLDAALRERHQITTATRGLVVEAKVVIVPDGPGNSLVIVTTPERSAEIHQLITHIDVPPKQFVVKARVTQIDPDGQRQLVGTPAIQTIQGRPVAIVSRERDGRRFEVELTIDEATPADSASLKNASAVDDLPAVEPGDWFELTVPLRQEETTAPAKPPRLPQRSASAQSPARERDRRRE